jgi:hypothetical protein
VSSSEPIIELTCPSCSGRITAERNLIGRQVRCLHCRHEFLLTDVPAARPPGTEATPVPAGERSAGKPFTFQCNRCGSVLEAGLDRCGKEGKCPTCGAVFTIPPLNPATGLPMSVDAPGDGQPPTPMHAYAAAGSKAPQIVRTETGDLRIRCPRCAAEAPIDVNNCPGCGLPFTLEGATLEAHKPVGGYAVASFAFGLASLPAGMCVLGVLPAAIAIVAGVVALQQANVRQHAGGGRGLALAGILCGILSLTITLLRL